MKEVFDQYVETTLICDTPTDLSLRLYNTNYSNLLPSDKMANILDIGVGVGGFLIFLRDLGYVNARGIDISPSTIRSCKQKGLSCELVEDTVRWLDGHVDEFDFICLLDVIEHIRKAELIGFLSAIRRSLKVGGRLLIQTNNMQAQDAQLIRYGDITHHLGFCETSLRQVCLTAGFKQVDIFGLETLYAFKRWQYVRQMPLKAVSHLMFTGIRNVYWCFVRAMRRLNCNLSPRILHPLFYAVVSK
jgi:2-polyprenyl-3-methyl-5-hydroxy-6-metoxy-1,4-benzoquinol methylase